MGGIVKRSAPLSLPNGLAMAPLHRRETIAKSFGLDDATHINSTYVFGRATRRTRGVGLNTCMSTIVRCQKIWRTV
jgi:hypothetical protein